MAKTIAVITGSLRKESLNRKLAKALEKLAEGKLVFDHVEIGDLPHYNEDLWDNTPAAVTRFKKQIAAADGVMIVTPEYNRSFPGVIKNALDWGSRPMKDNSWSGKPGVTIGTSPGAIGTAVAQTQLQLAMLNVGMRVMHLPEAYVQWSDEKFGTDGEIKDAKTRDFLSGWIDAVVKWVG